MASRALRTLRQTPKGQGVDDEDVEPGDVICDDQAPRWRIGRFEVEADGKYVKNPVRPALFQPSLLLRANAGVDQRRTDGDPRKMQSQSQAAVSSHWERGW